MKKIEVTLEQLTVALYEHCGHFGEEYLAPLVFETLSQMQNQNTKEH